MVNKFSLFIALGAIGAVASQQSICDKYTTALLKHDTPANQYMLLTLLVNTAVIGNYTEVSDVYKQFWKTRVTDGLLSPAMVSWSQVF